ncbi:MAG: hypothetical protein WCJ35_07865 [Planctomycetota bacterium]
MSDTIPTEQPAPAAPAAPARLPVDLFFDQVVAGVHRHEARTWRAATPYRYSLSATASFSGLPIRLLQKLCREGWFQSTKIDGHWLLHRDDFNSLLAPDVPLPCRAARQYILIRNLQQLAAMLHHSEAECTLRVLLRDLQRAVMFHKAGACYDDTEGMVWHRAEWRIRDGLVDADQMEEALGLLQAIIGLGMDLLRNIDWRHSRLVSMIAERVGVDLAV